jgi:hypothetical protein
MSIGDRLAAAPWLRGNCRLAYEVVSFLKTCGEDGSRFATGGIVLTEEAFEPEKPFGVANTLRRFVAGRASRCVKLGGSLALVLSPAASRETLRI